LSDGIDNVCHDDLAAVDITAAAETISFEFIFKSIII
jgi:hypothetical protein